MISASICYASNRFDLRQGYYI